MLDVSLVSPATPGDTQPISDELSGLATIKDSRARDREYQKLALKAAVSADTRLAEEIISKITDDSARRDATLLIYSPLVKKAIADADWPQAHKLASMIKEPLGRSLAFDQIAQAMSKGKQEKSTIIDVYNSAIKQLDQEFASERVAKAYIVLAGSLHNLDEDSAVEALKSFAYTINKLSIKDTAIEESAIESPLSIWVPYTNPSLSADELMNLPDMVSRAFQELARRDVDAALAVSMRLRDQGIYSFAQLAIARVLLEQADKARPARVKRAGVK